MQKKTKQKGNFKLTFFLGVTLVILVISLGLSFFSAISQTQVKSRKDFLKKQTELAATELEISIKRFEESAKNLLTYANQHKIDKEVFSLATRRLFNSYPDLIDTLYVTTIDEKWLFTTNNRNDFISFYTPELQADGSKNLPDFSLSEVNSDFHLSFKLNFVRFTSEFIKHYYLGSGGGKLLMLGSEIESLQSGFDFSLLSIDEGSMQSMQRDVKDRVMGVYDVHWHNENNLDNGILVQYPFKLGSIYEDASLLFFVESGSITAGIYKTYLWFFFGFVILLIGTVVFFLISLQNKINSQRQLENNAQEISELFDQQNLLLKEMKGFFFFHNYKGEITRVSSEVEKILGHTMEDFLLAFNSDNGQKDAMSVRDKVIQAIDAKKEYIDLEYDFIRPDGAKIRLRISERLVLDDLGRFNGGVGICADITDQYKQRQELIQSGNRLQTLIDNIPDIIFLYDNDGKILLSHVQNQKQLIKEWRDLVGKNLIDAIPDANMDQTLEAFRRARKTGHIQTVELTLEVAQGFQYFEVRFFPLDEDKMMSITKEITNQRNWEKGLVEAMNAADQANRSKSEFLANMSHEIRTPLNGLLGIIDLLDLTELNEVQTQYLDIIKGSGNSLLSIIKDILDYSKIEAGKIQINSMVFSPAEEMDRQIQIFYGLAKQKNISIITNYRPGTDLLVEGDAEKINQITLNIVGNAVKFTSKDGEVKVNLEVEPISDQLKYLSCTVSDNGIGIPEEEIERLTDPFFQLESSNSRSFQGTGLGLAIAKKLTELMGGELKVSSKVKVGTVFSFTVILKNASDKINSYSGTQNSEQTNWIGMAKEYPMRILLAEDNELNLQLMTLMFEQFGYSFDVAKNGVEALDQVNRNKYDLLLMDVQMPIMNGLEATKKIRELDGESDLYIIGLSANVFDEDRKKAFEVGMNDYLTKPIRLYSMAEKIKEHAQRMSKK